MTIRQTSLDSLLSGTSSTATPIFRTSKEPSQSRLGKRQAEKPTWQLADEASGEIWNETHTYMESTKVTLNVGYPADHEGTINPYN